MLPAAFPENVCIFEISLIQVYMKNPLFAIWRDIFNKCRILCLRERDWRGGEEEKDGELFCIFFQDVPGTGLHYFLWVSLEIFTAAYFLLHKSNVYHSCFMGKLFGFTKYPLPNLAGMWRKTVVLFTFLLINEGFSTRAKITIEP